ncbi:MAG: hypothetical protein ACJAUC_002508 [Planctomycetota bacterium]|jgi:hypothetical protein
MHTLLLVAAILTSTVVAQDPVPAPSVTIPAVPPAAPQGTAPVAAQHWIQRLGSDSYRDRLEAEDKLREMGGNAKAALDTAAKDGRDGEVQWRAKRLLRQLEKARLQSGKAGVGKSGVDQGPGLVERRSTDGSGAKGRSRGPTIERRARADRPREIGGREDMRNEFERLFRDIEKMHGLDVPRDRIFDDTFFKGLNSQMQPGSRGNSKSVQVGPDGVHVEVTEPGKDGKPETKVYDAPNMEAFLKMHPGVLQETRGGLGLRSFDRSKVKGLLDEMRVEAQAPQRGFEWQLLKPRVVPFEKGFRPSPEQPRSEQPRSGQADPGQPSRKDTAAVPPTGRRLGIQTKAIPESLRAYLEMAPDIGLMVDAIQEDTLAAALRLQSGDIVTKINGSKVGSPDDVQKALGAIKKGADVEVEFIRRGDRREATTKKQHDAQAVRGVLKPGSNKRVRESIR